MFLILFFSSCSSISEKDCSEKECNSENKLRPIDYIGGRDR
jgi:hypothetical protein